MFATAIFHARKLRLVLLHYPVFGRHGRGPAPETMTEDQARRRQTMGVQFAIGALGSSKALEQYSQSSSQLQLDAPSSSGSGGAPASGDSPAHWSGDRLSVDWARSESSLHGSATASREATPVPRHHGDVADDPGPSGLPRHNEPDWRQRLRAGLSLTKGASTPQPLPALGARDLQKFESLPVPQPAIDRPGAEASPLLRAQLLEGRRPVREPPVRPEAAATPGQEPRRPADSRLQRWSQIQQARRRQDDPPSQPHEVPTQPREPAAADRPSARDRRSEAGAAPQNPSSVAPVQTGKQLPPRGAAAAGGVPRGPALAISSEL